MDKWMLMKYLLATGLFIVCAAICGVIAATLQNSLQSDVIVLREGDAFAFTLEGKMGLSVGVGAVQGGIFVSEIDTKGKNLSVSWSARHVWESTTLEHGSNGFRVVRDTNMDGIADLRALSENGANSFRMGSSGQTWTLIDPLSRPQDTQPVDSHR